MDCIYRAFTVVYIRFCRYHIEGCTYGFRQWSWKVLFWRRSDLCEGKFPLYVELLTQLTDFQDICDGPDPLCTVVASTCRCWKTAFRVSIKSSSMDFFVWKTNTGFYPWSFCNAVVKFGGGAVGITDNPAAIRCWTFARPKSATWPMTLDQFQKSVSENHWPLGAILVYPSSVLERSNISNLYFSIHGKKNF